MTESLRNPSHRKVAPGTPCEGCEEAQVSKCEDTGGRCQAWRVYEGKHTGPEAWTEEQRGVFV